MRITFIGTDSVLPDRDNDTASYLVDDHTLIDTGLYAYASMRRAGADMHRLKRVLFTHLHHDHYLGLPGLLFMLGHGQPNRKEPLEIYGPRLDLREHVRRATAYLWAEKYPGIAPKIEIHELDGGETFTLGDYQVTTCLAKHQVPSIAYRFEHAGQRLATICGDTAPHRPLVEFARGSRLLIHEASFVGMNVEHMPDRGHSTAREAAQLARDAAVERLALAHFHVNKKPLVLEETRGIFDESRLIVPRPGESIDV